MPHPQPGHREQTKPVTQEHEKVLGVDTKGGGQREAPHHGQRGLSECWASWGSTWGRKRQTLWPDCDTMAVGDSLRPM